MAAKEKKWNWDLFENPGGKRKDEIEVEMSETELEKLSELLDRATPLIEQVNSLYNQYRCGVDKRPPNERRMILDQIIGTLTSMRKPTAGARFRVRQVVSKYLAYKDRWDRIVAMMENGRDSYTSQRQKVLNKRPGRM